MRISRKVKAVVVASLVLYPAFCHSILHGRYGICSTLVSVLTSFVELLC